MMSLSLAYYLAIAPVNMLLKCFTTSGSPRSILSISSDSEVASRRINLESNDTIVQYGSYESMVPHLAEMY